MCSGCPVSARSPGWISGRMPWRRAGCSPPVPTRCRAGSSDVAEEHSGGRRIRRDGAGTRPRPACSGPAVRRGHHRAPRRRAAPLDASLFTHAAMTAGRSAVAINEAAVARGGLGYRAVVVQASDGLPPYDFAMFEPRSPLHRTVRMTRCCSAGASAATSRPVRTSCSSDARSAAHRGGRGSTAGGADGVAPAAHRVGAVSRKSFEEAHLRLVLRSGRTDVAQIRAMLPGSVAEHARGDGPAAGRARNPEWPQCRESGSAAVQHRAGVEEPRVDGGAESEKLFRPARPDEPAGAHRATPVPGKRFRCVQLR